MADLMILPASVLLAAARKAKQRGHAAAPGTGPDGETCRSCKHLERKEVAKTFLKCGLMHAHWTGGAGTDVRAGDAACEKWEAREGADG